MGLNPKALLLFLAQKVIFMCLLHGGRQIILKFDVKIKLKIRDIFTNSMARASDMNWSHLQGR